MGPAGLVTGPEPDAVGTETGLAPAFYATERLARWPRLLEWWTVLHPPYTLWHLSYVVIGSCLVAPVDRTRLVATVLAFFLAVGVGAHALDEVHGRPLRTDIPVGALVVAGVVGIGGAAVIGLLGVARIGVGLVAFVVCGVVLAVGYNLELVDGRLHTDGIFALSWGAFPVLTGYYAQHERLTPAAVVAAAFAFFLSRAQRQLSTPARLLRRKTSGLDGRVVHRDGSTTVLDRATVLAPLEHALRALTCATVALAGALAIAHPPR